MQIACLLEDKKLKEKEKKRRERIKKELEQRQLVLDTNHHMEAVGGQRLLQTTPASVRQPQHCSIPIRVDDNDQEIIDVEKEARMLKLIENVFDEVLTAGSLREAIVRQQKTIDEKKKAIEKLENLEVLSLDHSSNVDPQSTVGLQNGKPQDTFDPNFGSCYDPVTGTFLDKN